MCRCTDVGLGNVRVSDSSSDYHHGDTLALEHARARARISSICGGGAGEAQLLHLDAQPVEKVNDLLYRQYLHGTNLTFVKWIAKKGAVVPLTHHINEQITWITDGLAAVYSQARKYIMKAGDIMIIPPNVPHEFIFLEDTIDIDIFAPGRQDWLDGTCAAQQTTTATCLSPK